MKPLKFLTILAVLVATAACTSSRAFREARGEEMLQHWDLAVLKYSRALGLEPAQFLLVIFTL